MPRIPNRRSKVPQLVSAFPRFLRVFEESPPFTRYGQLEFHLETIRLRRALGSVAQAIADDEFLAYLYKTLQAWGIDARAWNLVPLAQFIEALRAKAPALVGFEGMCIDDPNLEVGIVSEGLWRTIESLGIVKSDCRIVPGSMALHHIIPDLVVPVDRTYTQEFFAWHNPEFYYGQGAFFGHSFSAFVEIARRINPAQYVGAGWNSSRSKIIDNAIVGMVREEQQGAC